MVLLPQRMKSASLFVFAGGIKHEWSESCFVVHYYVVTYGLFISVLSSLACYLYLVIN